MVDRAEPDFRATTAPGGTRSAQVTWFRQLSPLPLARVEYVIGTHDASVEDPDRFVADVDVQVQVDGFDSAPVPSTHRMTFHRTRTGWRVARDHIDPAQVSFAPWEMPGSVAVVGDGVLLFFDQQSAPRAARILPVAEAALRYVADSVPYDWSRRVMILMPSTQKDFEYEGFDPREIAQIGGVAYSYPGPDFQPAGMRVLIASTQLDLSPEWLGVLLRHEIAHVAIGTHDDEAPVWLREGLAEYVGHREQRYTFGTDVGSLMPEGDVTRMPPDGPFHASDWGPSYLVAWYSVLWLATARSAEAPWGLLSALEADPGDFRHVSRLLHRDYDVTTDELARRAGDLIRDSIR